MMASGAELLALTEAAVVPLLNEGPTTATDIVHGTPLHSYTIFSPIADRHTPSGEVPPLPSDHTPSGEVPPLPSDHTPSKTVSSSVTDPTPSPLTISARDVVSEDGGGVETSGGDNWSPWTAGTILTSPHHTDTTHRSQRTPHPTISTPHTSGVTPTTPTPHSSEAVVNSPSQGAGRVRIKISTRKLREIASPLILSPSNTHLQGVGGLPLSESPLSCESVCLSGDTLRALRRVNHPPPLSSLSLLHGDMDTARPSSNDAANKQLTTSSREGKSLAQGVMKTTGNASSADTSLENSIIVSQIKSAVPTHDIKGKLLEQQAHEKNLRFKVVQPRLIKQQPGENLGTSETKKGPKCRASYMHSQKGRGVGGERDSKHSRLQLQESRVSKPQAGPGTELTSLPVSSLPPPRHLTAKLTPEPTNKAFPVNPVNSDCSSPDNGSCIVGSLANATPWHLPQQKQFPYVSSSSDHALADSDAATNSTGSPAAMASITAASQTARVSLPPHTLPRLHDVPTRHNPHLDFEETVKLVASCTAAATAAIITSHRDSGEEAKMTHDVQPKTSLSNLTSKEIKFDDAMYRNQPTDFFSHTPAGGLPSLSHIPPPPSQSSRCSHMTAVRGGGVFSSQNPQEDMTGVKAPTLEKPTAVFTLAPQQSQPGGGFGPEHKHPTLLNNQTPLATERREKTQEDVNYCRHRQGSPPNPKPCNSDSRTHINGSTAWRPEELNEQNTNVKPSQSETPTVPSISAHQHTLTEVENMLMEVQEARKNLELRAALSEVQAGWSNPPLPSDDPTDLGLPKHRVTVFLNQLSSASGHSMTSHDNEREEMMSSPSLAGKKPRRIQRSQYSKASRSLLQGGEGGKMILHARTRAGNSKCFSQPVKQKGSVSNKEKCPVRKPATRKPRPSTIKALRGERLQQQKEGNRVTNAGRRGETSFKPRQEQSSSEGQSQRAPPPSLPLLNSQVQAPVVTPHPGIPVAAYTLPPGVVVCDPTTGVPLLGSSAVSGAQMFIAPPPPPCVHMPTAIPLAPPSTVRPATVTLAESADDPTVTSRISRADVGLQTSFTERGTTVASPRLVQEVLPAVNIPNITEPLFETVSCGNSGDHRPSPATRSSTTTAACGEDENLQLNSSANIIGISLIGTQSGASPSESTTGPSIPSSQQWTEAEPHKSAEEISRKINERLESQVTEWVTQELLTRVLAAAQSHDVSCNQSAKQRVNCSPNSCSTCTSPTPHPPSLTTPHVPNDITGMACADGGVGGEMFGGAVVCGGGAGEGVRSDVVEVVVREVIREKVVTALREAQSSQRKDEEENINMLFDEEREDSGHAQSDDSAPTTPHILTPSPSPPPQLSTPPSPSSHDSSPRPQLATPTTTPPTSRRSDSTIMSPPPTIPTPQETEEDMSVLTPKEVTPCVQDGAPTSPQHTLSTPTPSPPHQTPPTLSPPSLTKQDDPSHMPSLSHPSPPQHTQFDLSESSSSTSPSTTSTRAHLHPHTLTTTTNLTTDQEISIGEGLLVRPTLPGATNSLSEGEVALSPGDACWYATYASKMGQLGARGRSNRNDNLPSKPNLTPVVAAFLELKNSPDSLCDTSDYSSSFKSDSNMASEGEVKIQQRRRGKGDPFDRFLANLQSSSPETSSTPTPPISEDNTLSDLPSIAGEDSSNTSCGEVKERNRSTPMRPLKSEPVRKHHSVVGPAASVPYHRKFPLREDKSASPGEIRTRYNPPLAGKKGDGRLDISVSFAQSEGQVHPTVHGRVRSREEERSKRPLPHMASVSSPGELRIKLNTSNRTRNGIDVINISKSSSPNSYSSFSRTAGGSISTPSQNTTQPTLSSLTSSHTHPETKTTTNRRLRVRDELEPARVISVASSLARKQEDATEDDAQPSGIGRVPPMAVTTVVHSSPTGPAASTTATRPPALESLLQTSSSSSGGVSPPLPLSERSTQEPTNGTEVAERTENRKTSPPLYLDTQLQSFWDAPSLPRTTPHHLPNSRVVKVQEGEREAVSPVALHVTQAADMRRRVSKTEGLPQQSGTDTHQDAAEPNLNATRAVGVTSGRDDGGTREGFVFNPSPTKTQLEISVPTATTKDEESPLTSPVPSPTYSSDFDFSSISQPTFD